MLFLKKPNMDRHISTAQESEVASTPSNDIFEDFDCPSMVSAENDFPTLMEIDKPETSAPSALLQDEQDTSSTSFSRLFELNVTSPADLPSPSTSTTASATSRTTPITVATSGSPFSSPVVSPSALNEISPTTSRKNPPAPHVFFVKSSAVRNWSKK